MLAGWLKNFLSNRIQCVVLDGKQSQPAVVIHLVYLRVAYRLAPFLFLSFINDLPDKITSKIYLYADDVLLYSTINSVKDC